MRLSVAGSDARNVPPGIQPFNAASPDRVFTWAFGAIDAQERGWENVTAQ